MLPGQCHLFGLGPLPREPPSFSHGSEVNTIRVFSLDSNSSRLETNFPMLMIQSLTIGHNNPVLPI